MSLSTMSAAKDSSWRTGKWPEHWTDEWPPTTTALIFDVEIISCRYNYNGVATFYNSWADTFFIPDLEKFKAVR